MEAQNLHVMGAEGPMKTKYTDGFNPTKTRAHFRMSNANMSYWQLGKSAATGNSDLQAIASWARQV